MSIDLIIPMVLIALFAVILYTIIGFIPGTDETSVLLPVTLALALLGLEPILILTFFITAIVTLNLTNLMPTALVGLPGGVLSSPMIEHSLKVKSEGRSAIVIKKMAAAAVIGVVVAIPSSFILAQIITPFAKVIQPYGQLLFVFGALFMAMLSKNKILSLLSILPLAILFMGLRYLYWGVGIVEQNTNITTSFFLGITIGPLIVALLSLLNKQKRQETIVKQYKTIHLSHDEKKQSLNPLKLLTKKEAKWAAIMSLLSSFLFVLSPVGLILLLGEAVMKKTNQEKDKPVLAITTMSALAQSTYLSGIIIPLFALGVPLSPTSIGPGNALFNAQPAYGLENNLHYQLSTPEFIIATLVGAIIAMVISYVLIHRYAFTITSFIMNKIPHEAVLSIFVSFILLLAYMDAGLLNVFGVLLIGITSGSLNKLGVNFGVQFMTLYAAPLLMMWLSVL